MSEKGASRKVGMDSGPFEMVAGAVALEAVAERSSALRRWIWASRLFIMEMILDSALYIRSLSGLDTKC